MGDFEAAVGKEAWGEFATKIFFEKMFCKTKMMVAEREQKKPIVSNCILDAQTSMTPVVRGIKETYTLAE